MSGPKQLPVEALYSPCDPDDFEFGTTADLEPLHEFIGQDRAVDSVRFAIGMSHEGYNLFAFGPQGTGKSSLVKKFLEIKSATQPVPDDWCYVQDFTEVHKAKALRLPPGRARPWAQDMEQLVEDLLAAIPAGFESAEYRNRRTGIEDNLKDRQEQSLTKLQSEAAEIDVGVVRTQSGLAVAPMHDGEMLNPEEFQKLPEAEQERRKAAMEEVQQKLEEMLREMPRWEKAHREQIRELNRELTEHVVGHLIADLETKYQDLPQVLTFLDTAHQDIIKHANAFLPDEQDSAPALRTAVGRQGSREAALNRYQVNVIVDNCDRILPESDGKGDASETHPPTAECIAEGAPVVEEENPTQPNLLGRIEHLAQMGALVTDFTMIKPGALHRANGGYLVLDARKLLLNPFAWESLKSALITKVIRYESPADAHGLISTVSLEPEPIPLNVKVVLLGEPEIYYTLSHYDPDFRKLFKVQADFDTVMDRDAENSLQYARLIATLANNEDLLPLDRTAVARVVEYGARLADDSEKLSTHMASVVDLVREANYWAGGKSVTCISAEHVQTAIDAKIYRSDRTRQRLQEQITRDTIVIDTDGERVGEVNGLAVYQLDHLSFGKPSRISCRVRLGRGEVIDIEREVALGGPLHTKGVLILSSYLASRFTGDGPLALSASLVFEQSYGGVDGDSASSTELYALLSAISEIPIQQCFAVTGSVDQHGRVQAIGGANEKIEGFFDICMARGLTGKQGVLIPQANVKHLMLRADVVEAVRDGSFAVYGVETIDQGIEVLTGRPAGEIDEDGNYPLGSVNRSVAAKLAALSRRAMNLAGPLGGARRETHE